MSSRSPPQYNDDVRELLRQRGEPIPQTVTVQERDGTARITLMRAALDQYDTVPSELTQYYDPKENAVIIPLPESNDSGQSGLTDF